MIYGSGYLRSSAMLKYGSVLSLSALLIFLLVVHFWWPVIGLKL
jgi:di/tricarboxylate transporter